MLIIILFFWNLGAITFGKPVKGKGIWLDGLGLGLMNHVGYLYNLKEFKVYVGEHKDRLVKVLHSGLYNDAENETLLVSEYVSDDNQVVCYHFLPCTYGILIFLDYIFSQFHVYMLK